MRIMLGEEAAGVVQQAVSLAGWRGHAQVSPLHIASAMLSRSRSRSQSSSHPLRLHNAIQLGLDVALDRLTVAARVDPAPSNAFMAALRRAQAHGRSRGGNKVELQQLVHAILDDPSVHRVMRAAGLLSSSLLVENAVSRRSSHAGMGNNNHPFRPFSCQSSPTSQLITEVGLELTTQNQRPGPPPAFIAGSEVVATTAIIPPWLRRYRSDTTPTRSTRCTTTTDQPAARRRPKFTELTAQNLKILCDALELRCPRHGDLVPTISCTLLRCRSGMTRKQSTTTWLLFRGRDSSGGKTAIARELARLVFGTYAEFTALHDGNSDEPTRSCELTLKKRRRSPGVGARLLAAILENPHRVILIDGLDRDSEMRIKDAVVEGTVMGCSGDVVSLEDAIVVLCSDVLDSRSPQGKLRLEQGDATGKNEVRSCRRPLGLDLNACPQDGANEEDMLADDDDDDGILNFVDGVFFFN